MERVLVTGGTGRIGTEFVHLMASDPRCREVRVATRDPDGPRTRLLRAMNPEKVAPVAFSIEDPSAVAAAMQGITGLFVIAPIVDDMAGWHARLAEAAQEAGDCAYIVKVSVTGARGPDSDPSPGRIPLSHWQGEEAIRATGIATTIIRPTIFMQHFQMTPAMYRRGDDRFYLPTGDTPVAFVDCRDIAHMAAALLLANTTGRADHVGKEYELTGPAAVSAADIADLLSVVAGRPIRHIDGEPAFVAHAAEIGASDRTKFIYAEAKGGWFSKVVTEAFEQITGRRPTSFAKFAHDHAAHFQPAIG